MMEQETGQNLQKIVWNPLLGIKGKIIVKFSSFDNNLVLQKKNLVIVPKKQAEFKVGTYRLSAWLTPSLAGTRHYIVE